MIKESVNFDSDVLSYESSSDYSRIEKSPALQC